jgi:hypothetical protein
MPSPFLFIHPSPSSWNSSRRYNFSIHTHLYTVFVPYSPSYTLSPPPPLLLVSTSIPLTPTGRVSPFCSFLVVSDSYTGSFLVVLPWAYIYIIA